MNNTPFIEMKNVAFAYGSRPILHDINFSIRQGDFAAVMGGSGSGKTTLMRLITGQIRPQQGQVLIEGRDLAHFSAAELYEHRRRMGVLFQHGALFTDLSVFDNIAFPMRELTQLPESVIRDLVLLKLDAVGLRGIEHLMPSELSGGMARRVALARTIALDPELMIYDEPFTGLDPISLGVIAHLISRANKALRSTSVMVTHDIEKSLQIVDQVIFLAHGKIIFSGSPEEMRQLDSPWVQQFIGGLADGPVAFRYPAPTSLKEDLLG
ncbi:ABC transporter ATP-binding protein [Neisseria sp. ZJ106]|uniref:ABC transporter ATP-binding protein n=1 Tax=Neisseria lisongii TaxID=2912188 RepID=A0AAW5ARD2_9NEIS|nr:ABC transporter ATP-binding protein [Neisseria lisongii]MCF7521014.1 ABC transporter ATP-binding protein [Neisseria lisongii]MCF7529958.1 ABC transporter ATP-binding protein [Neisseria lisongii]WCL71186.1 ABC transporter ATP-binding protein [Neisseria lisongii]